MQTNTDELVGTRVGSCTLERLLGAGGMSAVYLARQERPRRQVAVKLLRAASAPSPEAWELTLARFHREADAAAALDHANILPIYEFGRESTRDGEIAYIVMPYLADGSLAMLLARQGPLSVAQAVIYLEQAAAALDHAHQAGIVHRDVKLSNLLLHPDGRLMLADFGIARALNGLDDTDLTASGTTMGTPEYMAPEQIRGDTVGPAADIYALGVTLYTLLAGHTPFQEPLLALVNPSNPSSASKAGDARAETRALLARQLTAPPPPVRTQRAGVSPRLEEAIFWALAKDPADRPPTAGALAQAARDASRSRALSAFFSKADSFLAAGFAASLPRFETPTTAPVRPVEPVAQVTPSEHRSAAAHADPPFGSPPNPAAATLATPASGEDIRAQPEDSSATMAGPDAPTIRDLPLLAWRPMPEWPAPTRGADEKRPFSLTKLVLIVAVALLGCAFLAGGLGAIGFLLQGNANSPTSLSSVTPTGEPTATPQLTVALAANPSSVTFPCRGDERSQTVTLTNQGQGTAQWTATLEGPQISVNPATGTLDPGERKTVTLSSNVSLLQERQGIVHFTTQGVGDQSALVSYVVLSCLRGNGDNGDGDNADRAQSVSVQNNEKSGKHGKRASVSQLAWQADAGSAQPSNAQRLDLALGE
jgi:serine/threonine protein kinase